MKIAIVGLGKMGMQITRKLIEAGHEVIAHDIGQEAVTAAAELGAVPAPTKQDVANTFAGAQAIVWVMIPADFIDVELELWLGLLAPGSIIIDGGNSDFRLTVERAKKAMNAGMQLIDVGTSGGVWGYDNGFSMMAGGDQAAYKTVEPFLQALAAPSGAYHYFGSSGSGHYVKMIHNAIEYGMMESLAEGYHMLKDGPYDQLDLAAASDVWQHCSVITSWLNSLCQQIFNENPDLEGIDGYVTESGEARWTLEVAKERGITLPAIQTSLATRIASQNGEINFTTKLLAAMRNKFGGHQVNKPGQVADAKGDVA